MKYLVIFLAGIALGFVGALAFHSSPRPAAAAHSSNRYRLVNAGNHLYRLDSATGQTWQKLGDDWDLIGAPAAPDIFDQLTASTNKALGAYDDLPMATNAGVRGVDYFDEDNAAPLAPTNLVQTSKPEPKP